MLAKLEFWGELKDMKDINKYLRANIGASGSVSLALNYEPEEIPQAILNRIDEAEVKEWRNAGLNMGADEFIEKLIALKAKTADNGNTL